MTQGTVERDDRGIPWVRAATADEVAYLQGVVVAEDRAWQIQTGRWRSEGRLAERAGPGALPWDRFARRARLDDTARRCLASLNPRTRRWIAAFVDGVNDGLARTRAPEFAATGGTPDRWRPWSPLGVFLVQHALFGAFPNKLWNAHVHATLGPAAVGMFGIEGPTGAGSNAWVVAGDPATGRSAVIAGDPHRLLELPGVYQQIRLTCPDFDVVGLAFPGVPGLPHFAHTGTVAWAVTNAMADYQDLYREELRRTGDRVEARDVEGWAPVDVRTEWIAVRGGAPVTVEVLQTPRGPVVDLDPRTGTALSLRSPVWVDGSLGLDALLPLLRARTVQDVADALRHWVEPVNAVLVADTTGAVRQLVAGRVPIRDGRCRRGPVPAWDPRFRWAPQAAPMPTSPVRDVAVHANDRRPDVAGLGADFAPPHRAGRIRDLLADGVPPSAVHLDDHIPTRTLRTLLDRLPEDAPGPAAARLRDRLLAWDGRMSADSGDAGAYAAWRAALARRLAAHPVLAPLHAPSGFDELFSSWTDPAARIGLALDGVVAGLPQLGGDPVPAAVQALEEVAAGPDPGTWGSRHLLDPVHLGVHPGVGAAVAALRDQVRLAGDTDAVLSTWSVPGVSDSCRRGPVARVVWDLGDRARGGWVVPFGAAGDPADPHFADQLPLWAAGELLPLPPWRPPAARGMPPAAHRPPVHAEDLPGLGRFTLAPLDPVGDAGLVHGWVTQRRAAFWGMLDHAVEDVREVYSVIDGLPTHHAYLIRLDDRPIGLLQSYDPGADPIGEWYPVQAGDLGMHLLLDPGRRAPGGLTVGVGAALVRFLFRVHGARRLVVEPDVRNHLALRRLERSGFTLDREIDLPDKRAQLAFLTRSAVDRATAHGRPAGVRSVGERSGPE